MSIVTHKEFSILCGMPSEGNVRVNISRGKIVTLADDKGLIDTDNPINLIFKQNYKPKAKSQPPPAAQPIETLYKEVVQVEEKPKRKASTKKELDQAEEMLSWLHLHFFCVHTKIQLISMKKDQRLPSP